MDLNLLKTFIKVAEHGSFTKAATELKQPKSRVSRGIARLEEELGVQLVRRTTRRTSLSSSGEEFFIRIKPLIAKISEELVNISEQQQEMAGEIKLTASPDIGQTIVAQMISKFNQKYPMVRFHTTISNDYLDLDNKNIDIAFRIGRSPDSNFIQKKLMTAAFILVCSKRYRDIHGTPNSIEELSQYSLLSFRDINESYFDGGQTPKVVSDSIPMLLNMALNDDGLATVPDFFCKDAIESQDLVRVLPEWSSTPGNIHILYGGGVSVPKRVKVFIQMVNEYCLK